MAEKSQEDFMWGALIGGAVGAAAMLLMTPNSGKEVRKHIQKSLQNLYAGKKQKSLQNLYAGKKLKVVHRKGPAANVLKITRRTTKVKRNAKAHK